jgi:hypothetical protein
LRPPRHFFRISRGALAALLFCALPLSAQRYEASVDAGAVALRYADTLNASAATLTPRAVADWGRGAAEVSGTYSQFVSGGWSAQGALSGSLFTPTSRGFIAELAGFGGGSAHQDGTRTGEVLANGRLHFMRRMGEFFAGAGGGRTWFGGGGSAGVLLGELGASTTLRDVATSVVLSPVAVDSLRYMDSQLTLSLTRAKLELGGVLGIRVGDQLTALGGTARSWGSLNAVRWVGSRFAVVAAGGTYPIDPTQGFPGGRFVSLSIRMSTHRAGTASIGTPPPEIEVRADDGLPVVTAFAAEQSGIDSVTLRVKAPRAQLVEVNGDFTGWTPVRMDPAGDGSWAVTLPMAPGKYQMNLRLNGGEWVVPPGLLSMLDEFGGRVGLLIVEPNTKL